MGGSMENNHAEQTYYKAGFALEEGKFEEAISLYLEAAEGGYAKAYMKLGDIYKQFGDNNTARQMYNQALALDPKNNEVDYEYNKRIETHLPRNKKISEKIDLLARIVFAIFIVLALFVVFTCIILSASINESSIFTLFGITKGYLIFLGFFGAAFCAFVGWVTNILIGGFAIIVRNNEEQIANRKKSNL